MEKKSSKCETGHAKNIANSLAIITIAKKIGPLYSPIMPEIEIAQLEAKYQETIGLQANLLTESPEKSNIISERAQAYKSLGSMVTQVLKLYKVTPGVTEAMLHNLQSAAKKIRGDHKAQPKDSDKKVISHSQMSYDQRANSFQQFIAQLEATPTYQPHEVSCQTSTLKAHYDQMMQLNQQVLENNATNTNFRQQRNQALYQDSNNLVKISQLAKTYLLAILPNNSLESKAVARIKFTNLPT